MLPAVDFCGLSVTRLIIGANPFGGYSHQNTDRDQEMRAYYNVARIKETDDEIKVLVLMHDEEMIEGLVVMIFSVEDDEPVLVFANIAGLIDMKALENLGEDLDLPGLDQLDFGN